MGAGQTLGSKIKAVCLREPLYSGCHKYVPKNTALSGPEAVSDISQKRPDTQTAPAQTPSSRGAKAPKPFRSRKP